MEILICVTLPDATKSSKYSTKYHPVNTFNYKPLKPYLNKSTYPQLNVVEGPLRSFGQMFKLRMLIFTEFMR